MTEENYLLSMDGTNYDLSFKTKEDAISEGMALSDDDSIFYVGEKQDPLERISFNVGEEVVELISCWMNDNFNHEVSYDWLCGSEGDVVQNRINKEIAPLIERIVREEAKPNFWAVKNITEHSYKNECES